MKIALLLQVILWAAAGDERPACPTRDAVAQALSPALGTKTSGTLPADVQITDAGDAFAVAVRGQVQRYSDPARDCVERARIAAVFVALALSPPATPPVPAPVPAIITAPPPPPAAPPVATTTTTIRATLAGRSDTGAGGGRTATSGTAIGGEARLSVGRRTLGIEATAGALSSTTTPLGEVRVHEQRFPCSVAATFRRHATTHVELVGALGVSLTPFTLHGQGLMPQSPGTRLDVGGRAELAARWTGHAVAPFAGVHVEYFPRTYDIAVTPLNVIGTTAPLQVGVSAGLDFTLRGPR
ncbi:MAG: hypothetical protein ACJ8F1_01745 [Polyangia bacterium]